MREPQFQSWFKDSHSRTLVVNGMESDAMQEVVSPLSYLCVLLSRIPSSMQIAQPITFFCGQHSTPGDPLEGASGIMRSLVSQVLCAYGDQIQLHFLDFSAIEDIRTYSIHTVCQLFKNLPGYISPGVVFCMIDSISWYETQARSDGMHMIMPFLQQIVEAVEASGSGMVFKLLITSPVMGQFSRMWFPRETELTMRPEIDGSRYGFGEYQAMAQSQTVLSTY